MPRPSMAMSILQQLGQQPSPFPVSPRGTTVLGIPTTKIRGTPIDIPVSQRGATILGTPPSSIRDIAPEGFPVQEVGTQVEKFGEPESKVSDVELRNALEDFRKSLDPTITGSISGDEGWIDPNGQYIEDPMGNHRRTSREILKKVAPGEESKSRFGDEALFGRLANLIRVKFREGGFEGSELNVSMDVDQKISESQFREIVRQYKDSDIENLNYDISDKDGNVIESKISVEPSDFRNILVRRGMMR